jgi:hypothetical protein
MPLPQRLVSAALAGSLLVQLSGCGTLFYPERRGQISGQIDPLVAALNGVGILFYVVPGLIAFAIDFTTGAIYLPGNRYSVAPEQLQEAIDRSGHLDQARLREVLQRTLGKDLPLDHPQLQVHPGDLQQLARLGLLTHA